MAEKIFDTHYISGTHWDREWYRPFQEFRYLLVELMDSLIERMETDAEFRFFQLDGQTCVLEDYLAIRPEMRDRLGTLIREGRILIGPWFTMPDLFCVGEEALIRNLLLGRRIAIDWGVEPMSVGFICDMFGHPSQMPQIFNGFGIRDVVLGRGTREADTPMFFNWEAPDGSQCFTFKLQDAHGYGALALPRMAMDPETFGAVEAGELAKALAADLAAVGRDAASRAAVREEHCRKRLAEYVSHEAERCNGSTLCLMDAMDHVPPAEDVPFYLRMIREAFADAEPHHSTLPAFFASARRSAQDVPVRRGELRDPSRERCPYLWLIPHCVSSRIHLKQANDTCQMLLERWAEPLCALAAVHGAEIPTGHLREAWRQVLLNQAHDSICGCSIDQVHRDMMYRYDQARVLADQLRVQAIGALTADCADLAQDQDEFTITLVNPLAQPRKEVVVFDVDLPPDWPTDFADGFNTQRLKAFLLEDAEGHPVPYQRLSFIPTMSERSHFARFCFQSNGPFSRYTVAAHMDLPACGFTSLRVRPSQRPVRTVGSLRTGTTSAANEHLVLKVAANGTLTLTDRASGETYRDLLTFEDRSETGDGWFHGPSLNEEQIVSSASPAQVAVIHDGPLLVSFEVTVTLQLPAHFCTETQSRSKERVEFPIRSRISLRKGARTVEIETSLCNSAADHRLRVLFPSDCTTAETYVAQLPFDFVERRITLDPNTADGQEMEVQEKPFLGAQAISSGRRGLAVLAGAGLHEGGVVDDERRSLALTLLRSYRKTVSTSGETDGLEPGPLTHRYVLRPFDGELPRAEILRDLAALHTGLLKRQTGSRASGYPPMSGSRPAKQSFIELEGGRLVVSAIKSAEDGNGLVVRLWNPEAVEQSDTLRFWRQIASASDVDLRELPLAVAPAPEMQDRAISMSVPPLALRTLRVTFVPDPAIHS